MDKLARRAAEDRRDIFSEAAARLGIRPTIIEKDFWVCVTLKFLFQKSRFRKSLVFKGGTSLSKAHGLIERFSEDIDLVLDWNLIGFGDKLRDPMQDFTSKGKQDQFNKEINRLAADYIAKTLCPELEDLLRQENVGLSAAVDPDDPHTVNIRYPAAFAETYIRPEVRLEIGPLASWVPSATHVIRPYAFDVVPEVFETRSVKLWRSRLSGRSGRKRQFFIRRRTGKPRFRNVIHDTTTISTNSLSVASGHRHLPIRSSCRT